MDILNLNGKEAKSVLKNLKLYANLYKNLGSRGRKIFEKQVNGKSYFTVEYYPTASEDYIYAKASEIYKEFFGQVPSKDEIVFVKKESILGGMKVYKDDEVVDVSFEKIEKNLRQ